MARRETHVEALVRWRRLEALQAAYPTFRPFLDDMMAELGFTTSPIQIDMGEFLEYGPHELMIQAQRGQAKTTITAIFSVWYLMHNPEARILIVSAGEKQANEISTLIVRIINGVDILECMRPDKTAGDRTSVEAYDIHYTLKGLEKSPSVACCGVTANLQGKRATLLIADDVESYKLSRTAAARNELLQITRDFTSICDTGRIIYLGTPQSQDSIYNSLPSRGYAVRIWPGRYPTEEQMKFYGDRLAPSLLRKMEADPSLRTGGGVLGDQGQPTDTRLGEEVLQKKERDQGTAYFQLQHMLSTAMTDAMRYPLKPENLIVMRLSKDRLPMTVVRGMTGSQLRDFSSAGFAFRMAEAVSVGDTFKEADFKLMTVDPAGGGVNGDETGYAIIYGLNGNVFLMDCGGVPGGYNPVQMETLRDKAVEWGVHEVLVEKNLGNGAFLAVWLPILRQKWKGAVSEDYVTSQKEARIIGTLEPVMGRGALIVNESIVEEDQARIARYAANRQQSYSFFFQLARLTRERSSLLHDDVLDAVEAGVRKYMHGLSIDQEEEVRKAQEAELAAFLADPLQHNRYETPDSQAFSTLSKYF